MLEELENEGRRNLIRSVRNADIEEGELNFDSIAGNKVKFVLITEIVHSLCNFSYHTSIDFDGNQFFAAFAK
jgi:hypothetical protein